MGRAFAAIFFTVCWIAFLRHSHPWWEYLICGVMTALGFLDSSLPRSYKPPYRRRGK
jgi:hypothetical protein